MTDVARSAPTRITDPEAVLILANPLRMRLLGELACRGSARVTDLAHQFAQPANTVNFHLRQLAKYGVLEEAHLATQRSRRVFAAGPSGTVPVAPGRRPERSPLTGRSLVVWRPQG